MKNLEKTQENLANQEFVDIAKDALKKGFNERKIFKILRKEGLFDEESEKIIFQALEEIRKEQLANSSLENIKPEKAKEKNNQLFKSVILEILISIIAFSIFPFRVPPSRGLKKFSLLAILAVIAWAAYSLFAVTKNPEANQSEKELLQQLKTFEQLQKSF